MVPRTIESGALAILVVLYHHGEVVGLHCENLLDTPHDQRVDQAKAVLGLDT